MTSSSASATTQPAAVSDDLRRMGFRFPAAPTRDQNDRGDEKVLAKVNRACVACHTTSEEGEAFHDTLSMHAPGETSLACIDCHGGNWDRPQIPDHVARSDSHYEDYKRLTHVFPTPT